MKYFIFLLLCVSLSAKDVAFVKSVEGLVEARLVSVVTMVKKDDILEEKMVIQTKENSKITIVFNDDSTLILGPNSILALEKYVFKPVNSEFDFKLDLQTGSASFESGKIGELSPQDFTLKTPNGIVGIRGTKFFVKVK